MTVPFDPVIVARNLKFLAENPEFEERPATIREFLGEHYLSIESIVRPGLLEALVDIFGEDVNTQRMSSYEEAMFTGAIGIGKTTFASIAIPYMIHHTLCLYDPQKFYGLMPGSRIAFMQMSTTAKNATEVIFGDLKARIDYSPWFINKYPYDPTFTKQMRFPKNLWVLPGDSLETSFEGYNILGGILDEMDSHKQTETKDYAEDGFNTIQSRISSRFTDFSDPESQGHRGLLICIGQMKKSTGFANKKYAQMQSNPKAYVKRMTIWESFGWHRYTRKDGTRASFFYDTKTKNIIPATLAGVVKSESLMEVPLAYMDNFVNNPEKALRDLAGIPPITGSPWISQIDKIEACRDRWNARHDNSGSPIGTSPLVVGFEPWFRAHGDPRKRACHIDLAYSGDGDACGIAVGYVPHMVERDGEDKPYIVIDCLIRLHAVPGAQVMISDVRQAVYHMKYDLGFRIDAVTMDGFQSTDTKQQLRKRKFNVSDLSADKDLLPYEDLRDAIYEERIEFPPYMTYIMPGDTDLVEITLKEIMELTFTGKKVDHPEGGSKDVADAVACVTTRLLGDRTYRRGLSSKGADGGLGQYNESLEATGTDGGNVLQFPQGGTGLRAPIPPKTGGSFGLTIPDRLKGR